MTPQQLQTLKTAILAETDPTFVGYRTNGQTTMMAEWLNGASAFIVWRSSTPTADILDAITWASLTPADTADSTVTFTNRALACQAKQLNLQILLQGRESLSTGKANVRQALTDALTNVPAGAGGVLLDAGWLGAGKVKTAIQRAATKAEKLYATGTGTSGQPGVLGSLDGPISGDDVASAVSA